MVNLINVIPFDSGVLFTNIVNKKKRDKERDKYFFKLRATLKNSGFNFSEVEVKNKNLSLQLQVEGVLLSFSHIGCATIVDIVNHKEISKDINFSKEHSNEIVYSHYKKNYQRDMLKKNDKWRNLFIIRLMKVVRTIAEHREFKKIKSPFSFMQKDKDIDLSYVYCIYNIEQKKWSKKSLNNLMQANLIEKSDDRENWDDIEKLIKTKKSAANNTVVYGKGEVDFTWIGGMYLHKDIDEDLKMSELIKSNLFSIVSKQAYVQSSWYFADYIKRHDEKISLRDLHKYKLAVNTILFDLKNGKEATTSGTELKIYQKIIESADIITLLENTNHHIEIAMIDAKFIEERKRGIKFAAKLLLLQSFVSVSVWNIIGSHVGFTKTYNAISIPILVILVLILGVIEYIAVRRN